MIVVDLAGGDFAPRAVIEGCLLFKNKHPECELILAGTATEQQLIKGSELATCSFLTAETAVEMEDNPLTIKPEKKTTTIEAAMSVLQSNKEAVFYSAGNSGAIVLSATSLLGVKNKNSLPIFAPRIPLFQGNHFLLLDAGATANRLIKGSDLLDFALSGAEFYTSFYRKPQPKIALLNVGSEKHKGRPEHKEAYQLLTQSGLNFIGNVEPDDLLHHNADIVVTDGFTGNLVLKMMEAFSTFLAVSKEQPDSFKAKISGNFNYEKVGGAPLLGVNGKVVVGHGKSTALAICSGLEFCLNYSSEN